MPIFLFLIPRWALFELSPPPLLLTLLRYILPCVLPSRSGEIFGGLPAALLCRRVQMWQVHVGAHWKCLCAQIQRCARVCSQHFSFLTHVNSIDGLRVESLRSVPLYISVCLDKCMNGQLGSLLLGPCLCAHVWTSRSECVEKSEWRKTEKQRYWMGVVLQATTAHCRKRHFQPIY